MVELTNREKEVLQLAATGVTVQAIAYRLGLGHGTVRQHLLTARRKLDAQNTTHAVALALTSGVISLT